MKTVYILVCSLLIMSCNDGMLKESQVAQAKSDIINKGDKRSYALLSMYTSRENILDEQLTYDLVMAYKYNDADAYFNIYENMIRLQNKNNFETYLIKNLDTTSRNLALNSLIKSSNLGKLHAKKLLANYYREGKYLPKDIESANKLDDEIKIIQ